MPDPFCDKAPFLKLSGSAPLRPGLAPYLPFCDEAPFPRFMSVPGPPTWSALAGSDLIMVSILSSW